MLKIYLARHGQDEDNAQGLLNGHRDRPLTALGLEQAAALAQKIKETGLSFDAAYSSPLQRAYVTARTITDALGMENPEKLPDLIERSYGVMTGTPIKDIELTCAPHTLKTSVVTYFLQAEGAESWPDVKSRAGRVLEQIKERHPEGGEVLAVCHGDLGKMMYAAYYGLEWKDVLCLFHFGNSELILLSDDSKPEDVHVFTAEQHNH